MVQTFYIGWDVGAWSCKPHKGKSCDALVVLDKNNTVLGYCREPLVSVINNAKNTKAFTNKLLELCNIGIPVKNYKVVLAIDTPLGFSSAFKNLITNYSATATKIKNHINNPYLFRNTEQYVQKSLGKKPLSPVNDMIGSQATKGIHVLSKFAPIIKELGVWCNSLKTENLTIIEAYPAIVNCIPKLTNKDMDIQDAYKCAYIAKVFHNSKELLEKPEDGIDLQEGWIWFSKNTQL